MSVENRAGDFADRDEPFRGGLNLRQRVQRKKRLVGRALITAAPDAQIAESLYQGIRFRHRLTDYQAPISDGNAFSESLPAARARNRAGNRVWWAAKTGAGG